MNNKRKVTTMLDLDRITNPLRLAAGSHQPGSGKGCAMNVISYINGDQKITDYPKCSARPLARLVQRLNDRLAGSDGFLSPEDSVLVVDLGWLTVGTAGASKEVQMRWLRDILVAPEMGVVKYATPRGEKAIGAVADLLEKEANGQKVDKQEWVGARKEARDAADAAASAAYAADAAASAAYAAYAAASAAYAAASAAYAADAAASAAYAADAAASAAYAADAAASAAYAADADRHSAAFTRRAILRWRELMGLDTASDIAPADVDSALARING